MNNKKLRVDVLKISDMYYNCENDNNINTFFKIRKEFEGLTLIFVRDSDNVYKDIDSSKKFIRNEMGIIYNEELSLYFHERNLLKGEIEESIVKEEKNKKYINNKSSHIFAVLNFYKNIEMLQKKNIEYKSNMNALVLKKGLSLVKGYKN